MTLTQMPYRELDRHHRQAKHALESAMRDGNETVYRLAEELEERYRLEKARRKENRETVESEWVWQG